MGYWNLVGGGRVASEGKTRLARAFPGWLLYMDHITRVLRSGDK